MRISTLSLTLLALTPGIFPQELTWTDAVLGSQVNYQYQGDPLEPWLLGISLSAGPTPIALVDPADSRSLSIGVEFLGIWSSGLTSAGGDASAFYPLPPDPAVVGVAIHAQVMTLPGVTTLLDDLSNPVSFVVLLPGTAAAAVGDRAAPVDEHGSSLLPDGRVLLSGGIDVTGFLETPLASCEIFDPQTQTFSPSGAVLAAPRRGHSATVLADGRVLLVGGRDGAGAATDAVEIYDPATDGVSTVAPMSAPRSQHSATLLADGRVWVVGGVSIDDPADPVTTLLSAERTTALYDPATDLWSDGPELPFGLTDHAASLLATGEVLVTGGLEITSLFGFPSQGWTEACYRFDPLAMVLLPAASLPGARAEHAQVVPASDPRPIVSGGHRNQVFLDPEALDEVLRYDPAGDAWTVLTPLNQPRWGHAMEATASQLVVVGGVASLDLATGVPTAEDTIEAAPLDASLWSGPVGLQLPRLSPRVTPVDGGVRLLITGSGVDGGGLPAAGVELYLP